MNLSDKRVLRMRIGDLVDKDERIRGSFLWNWYCPLLARCHMLNLYEVALQNNWPYMGLRSAPYKPCLSFLISLLSLSRSLLLLSLSSLLSSVSTLLAIAPRGIFIKVHFKINNAAIVHPPYTRCTPFHLRVLSFMLCAYKNLKSLSIVYHPNTRHAKDIPSQELERFVHRILSFAIHTRDAPRTYHR